MFSTKVSQYAMSGVNNGMNRVNDDVSYHDVPGLDSCEIRGWGAFGTSESQIFANEERKEYRNHK